MRCPWSMPLLLLAGACALSAPPAESVLGGPTTGTVPADDESLPLAQRGERRQADLDRLAADALQAARAAPADPGAARVATARLFQAADLRLQRATLAVLEAEADAGIDLVLAADDRIPDAERTPILALCTEGLKVAEVAVATSPTDVALQLHCGLHLSLIAWANGPARSLFAGYGPRLVKAIDAAVAAEAEFDHGAPLRLQGRFRGKAPWPYGDLPVARRALERAVAAAPIAVNHLFLGDVLWAAGERDAARAQWQFATQAPGDDSTAASTPWLVELARRRLAAATR